MRGVLRALGACVVVGLVPAGTPLRADRLPADVSKQHVQVILITDPSLSNYARSAMMNEAAAIWKQHGVKVHWLPPTSPLGPAANRLRVLVVSRRPLDEHAENVFAVGELVRAPNTHPLALLSISSAQRLVSSVTRKSADHAGNADGEFTLGVVLGRALAHELGHFLLDTPTHAPTGLMRPQFSALEFTDPRDDVFALDSAAEAWLRRAAGRFSYAAP